MVGYKMEVEMESLLDWKQDELESILLKNFVLMMIGDGCLLVFRIKEVIQVIDIAQLKQL